jgi:retron-type reverse transcriptase
MVGTPSPQTTSTKQLELAQRAERYPHEALSTLAHFIDLDWLREAYRRTRKDGAPGVDGQVAAEYEADLEANLSSLLDRFKSGLYRAPPVKRVYIPKGDGKRLRPIGIPTLEDKVLQRAVVMILEPLYEQQFLDASYGFRPGRSAHQALDALWQRIMPLTECWLIGLDIESFFDRVDRARLREMEARRVSDGVILRVIGKWLQAGVLEGTQLSHPEHGTPQGGVISPLLANIYLHEVLDQWFEQDVKPRLKGTSFMSLVIGGFLLLKTNGEHVADSALPQYLSEKRLASIAESIVEPFNAGDFDALYNVFDPAARAQISADTLKKQLDSLRSSIGKIEAASYIGWQKIPSPGTLPMYQLQYSLKLSGGNYLSGSLSVKVMDHGDHEGVIFFFVAGTTPK